jgi:hypothetical protein
VHASGPLRLIVIGLSGEVLMKHLALCLALAAVVSGCVTPSGQYAAIQEVSSKARTLQEAIQEYRSIEAKVGQKVKLELAKSDDILLAEGYLSYYRVFSFDVVGGRGYKLAVISSCDCLGFHKLVALPVVYVVDSEGKIVSGMLQRLHQLDSGELINGLKPASAAVSVGGEWGFTAEKDGRYHLVLAADNSSPGSRLDTLKGYNKDTGSLSIYLNTSPIGMMVFKVDSF